MNEDHKQVSSFQSVHDYYDRVAETWDETHGVARQSPRFARQVRDNLKAVLAGLDDHAVALEIGAGTGPYVDIAAPRFAHLYASDVSEGMLAVFHRRIDALGLTNVTLLRQDACELGDVATSSIDVVFSIGLLETIADLDQLFRAIHRVLKSGGVVAGITSNGDCPWYVIRKWFEGGERHGRTGQLATARSLDGVLQRTGFIPPQITHWGTLPPWLHNRPLSAVLGAVEGVIAPSPLARYLGVLNFRSRKI